MIAESTATQLALMHAPLPFPKLVERIKGTGGIPFAASLRATPSHASPGDFYTFEGYVQLHQNDERYSLRQTLAVTEPTTFYGCLMVWYPYGVSIVFVTEAP